MSKRKCPESEVRGGVADGPENEFNCFNQLVNKDLAEYEVMVPMRIILLPGYFLKKFISASLLKYYIV